MITQMSAVALLWRVSLNMFCRSTTFMLPIAAFLLTALE